MKLYSTSVSFTEELFNYFGREITELSLIPSKGGVFEVEVNGTLVYSKLEIGQFPDLSLLMKEIDKLVSG